MIQIFCEKEININGLNLLFCGKELERTNQINKYRYKISNINIIICAYIAENICNCFFYYSLTFT